MKVVVCIIMILVILGILAGVFLPVVALGIITAIAICGICWLMSLDDGSGNDSGLPGGFAFVVGLLFFIPAWISYGIKYFC